MARAKQPPATEWQNRITRFDPAVKLDELVPNPLNARTHPEHQKEAVRESMERVGWVGAVLVNERTGYMVDGHERLEDAEATGQATVPVLYVDLDPDEEAFVLATFDPITVMASYDPDNMRALIDRMAANPIQQRSLGALLEIYARQPLPELDHDGKEPDPRKFWPHLDLALPPAVLTAWNERLAETGQSPEELLETLLGVTG